LFWFALTTQAVEATTPSQRIVEFPKKPNEYKKIPLSAGGDVRSPR